jgi:acyl phosphate:glycerol-3-phosphate acyltransferase
MNRTLVLLALIPLGYLMGSIPFGLLVGRAKGIDPRSAGSGNIGATNLGRLLGGRYFALVFTLDGLKGLLPVLAGGCVLNFTAANQMDCLLWILIAIAALLGHSTSIFLKFKGGKGVATSAGVIFGIWPYFFLAGCLGMLAFVVIFKLMRYVSVASMGGAVCFALTFVIMGLIRHWPIFDAQLPFLIFALLIPTLIIYKHRANIARLRAGTELRIARKSL